MADITEDLLQTLAAGDPIAMLLVATAGKPVGRELRAIAAELREARARIAKLEHEPPHLPDHVRAIVQERDAARAEVAAVEAAICDRGVSERDCGLPLAERVDHILLDLKQCRFDLAASEMENAKLRAQLHADDQRAWEALGKPEGTYTTTNVQRLCAEVERLRDMLSRLCFAVERSTIGHGVYEEWYEIEEAAREIIDAAKETP